MISHKLNEIEQIADEITIIRDGKTIETLAVAEDAVDEDRIIRGMVGRDLEHRFPEHEPEIGEVLFELEDWSVMHPLDASRAVIRDANLTVRAGEIVGIAGLMGAGRTELARSVFGRSYGSRVEGRMRLAGKELHLRSVHAAIDAGIAYLTEDRKVLGLNLLDDIKRSITSAGLDKIRKGLTVDQREEVVVAEKYRTSMNIKTPTVNEGVSQALGRQPAEGRAVQVDVHRPAAADPRRADARHRRRRQVRDLRRHPAAGQAGPRRHRDLLRAARAARAL